jgi:hypothetical protein
VRIFRPDIDEAPGRAHREACDDHPFDQGERIALHEHPVGEGAAVALVRIADHVFPIRLHVQDGAPLDAGGKARPAAPAQAGELHLVDDLQGRARQGALKALEAAMGAVIRHRDGIDHAAAGEDQALLPGERGHVLHPADAQRVISAGEEVRVEKAGDVGRLNRPIGDPAPGGVDLHEGLEPEEAAGPGPDDLDRDALLRRKVRDGAGQPGGAEGEGGCILRDEDSGHALRASLATPSRMPWSRRATGSPS